MCANNPQVDAAKIGELALEVEKDINEAVDTLTILNARVARGTISKDGMMKRIGEAINALKR